MLSSLSTLSFAQLAVQVLGLLHLVTGAVFITHPYGGITCEGGQNCTVTWADDGQAPLLNAIGPCDFGLYEGSQNTFVQQIALGLDVSQVRALSFTVDSMTGPNSNSYYIGAIATSAKDPNNSSIPYMSFSGRFTMSQMRGKTDSPDPSALKGPAVNSTSIATQSNGIFGTTTVNSFQSSATSLSSRPASQARSSTASLLSSASSNTSSTATRTGTSTPASVTASSAKKRLGKDLKKCVRGGAMVLGAIVFSGGTLL